MNGDTALLQKFLSHLRVERGLSKSTEATYRYQLEGYLRGLVAQGIQLALVTKDIILEFLSDRKKGGLKPSSLFSLTLAIRQLHRFLFTEGLLSVDPTATLKLPKFDQKIPEPLSVTAMETLLRPPSSDKFTLVRTAAAIECAYDLGLRASELVHLKLGDLNLDEGWMRIRRGKGGRERILPLGPKLVERLRHYLEARAKRFPKTTDNLFLSARGKPLSRTTFWWLLKQWAKRSGVRGRVAPHQLRHSFCSHMLAGGASLKGIQNLAGHRRLSSTERYLHLDLDFLRESLKNHPRFGK